MGSKKKTNCATNQPKINDCQSEINSKEKGSTENIEKWNRSDQSINQSLIIDDILWTINLFEWNSDSREVITKLDLFHSAALWRFVFVPFDCFPIQWSHVKFIWFLKVPRKPPIHWITVAMATNLQFLTDQIWWHTIRNDADLPHSDSFLLFIFCCSLGRLPNRCLVGFHAFYRDTEYTIYRSYAGYEVGHTYVSRSFQRGANANQFSTFLYICGDHNRILKDLCIETNHHSS